MKKLRHVFARPQSGNRATAQQPDYCSEVAEGYAEALQAKVDQQKPDNFKLTPISAPGW